MTCQHMIGDVNTVDKRLKFRQALKNATFLHRYSVTTPLMDYLSADGKELFPQLLPLCGKTLEIRVSSIDTTGGRHED